MSQEISTTCSLETAIPDWLVEHPETAVVFQQYNLDVSCGGKSLEYVCQSQNLSAPIIFNLLLEQIARSRQ